jgi:uncharacterized protein YjiS (DUF1127 family)
MLQRSICCAATGDAVMATLTHDTHSISLNHPLAALRQVAARFQAWRAARAEYAEAMHSLAQIDNRDLHDLGISQYDFEAIARGDYRR